MTKELNIGIVGLGTVGSGVIKSIEKNKDYFKNNYDVKFNIIGISLFILKSGIAFIVTV